VNFFFLSVLHIYLVIMLCSGTISLCIILISLFNESCIDLDLRAGAQWLLLF
jgi:hypothetical protein